MCKRRSVRLCCHEVPHGEAIGSLMRLFHTVSEGFFSETGLPVLCISVFLGGLAFEEIDDDPAGFVSYTRLVVRL